MFLLYQNRLIPAVLIFIIITVITLIIRRILRKRCRFHFFLKTELGMLGILLVLFLCGYFGKWVDVSTIHEKTYSKEDLTKDLHQLKDILCRESPLYYSDAVLLEKEFAEAEKEIRDAMTEEEFYRLVNPVVVKVQGGHTNLSISEALEQNRETNAKFLPVDISIKENTLWDSSSGEEILSINGNAAGEILSELLSNVSHDGDNLSGAYYILEQYFATKYYDFIEQPDSFEIEYRRKDGSTYKKTVAAEYDSKLNVNAWNLRMASYEGMEYYSSSFSGEEAVLTLRVFMQGSQPFDEFLEEFFKEAEEKKCKKVILDVRGNFGGDPRMAKELLSYLITSPFTYFKSELSLTEKLAGYGKEVEPKYEKVPFESELWVDGACFSTCGHFAAIYQSLGLGKVVGEPTGGGSICTDSSKNAVLYHTGLRLHYAARVFEVNADSKETCVVYPD